MNQRRPVTINDLHRRQAMSRSSVTNPSALAAISKAEDRRWAAFEVGDGTMGSISGMRSVVLRGTTAVSQLFSPNLFNIADWIKTALRNNGFDVVNVRTTHPNWVGYATNLEIELNVLNQYTSDQARQNAISAIEAYRANFGLNKVFSNTTLSVSFDGYQPPSSGGSNNPRPTPSPPSSHDQSNVGAGGSDFLDKFALGLGVSTPVVLLLGAGALILILRR